MKTEESVSTLICVECEKSGTSMIPTVMGAMLCEECMTAYYVACRGCEGIVPQDEAFSRADLRLCAECYAKPLSAVEATLLDQSGIESLIAEYTTLHAEEKRIGTRMEEIKELLKDVALRQERVSGAVTLRAGDAAVKCNFRTTLKFDTETVEKLEQTLDESEFGELFERKVSYSPHKESVQEFLSSTDGAHEEARELLRAAVRETETATLTVVPVRKQ